MNKDDEILRALGYIEGELAGIRDLYQRVAALERWQFWLRGGWAALTAAYLHLCKTCRGGL
ncbi:MAG TPA: hypothetical protein VGK48_17550 [Terriglobia bacterium]|jgi:hypothetical protein